MNGKEYDYSMIEKNFVDYIINIAGPNEEVDEYRQSKISTIKQIINKGFMGEQDIIVHFFSFGSFPFKDYHKDSDIDVTVILEDKKTNKLKPLYTCDSNRILNNIEASLRSYFSQFFPDGYVERIDAKVKLIKCKFDGVSFDISINNFDGLSKLIFMHYLENNYLDRYFYKKTIVLIKTWCYYEGCILGSNIGLLGSYALEILVIYMFNIYSDKFTNEMDAFFTFFNLMSKVNWETQVLTIYGLFDINQLTNNYGLNLENLFKEYKFSEKEKIKYDQISEFVKQFERFNNFEKVNTNNKKVIQIGNNMHIIDPIFNTYNLGKSVNFHNYSRIKELFLYISKKCNELVKSKMTNSITPSEYLNSLLNLFHNIVISSNSDLFKLSLPEPKIIILPSKNKGLTPSGNNKKENEEEILLQNFNNKHTIEKKLDIPITENVIKNSNEIFSMLWPSNGEIQNEQTLMDYYSLNISNVNYITKNIIEFFNNPHYKRYEFITSEDVKEIEEFEKNAII